MCGWSFIWWKSGYKTELSYSVNTRQPLHYTAKISIFASAEPWLTSRCFWDPSLLLLACYFIITLLLITVYLRMYTLKIVNCMKVVSLRCLQLLLRTKFGGKDNFYELLRAYVKKEQHCNLLAQDNSSKLLHGIKDSNVNPSLMMLSFRAAYCWLSIIVYNQTERMLNEMWHKPLYIYWIQH